MDSVPLSSQNGGEAFPSRSRQEKDDGLNSRGTGCAFSCALFEEDPGPLVTHMSTFLHFATCLFLIAATSTLHRRLSLSTKASLCANELIRRTFPGRRASCVCSGGVQVIPLLDNCRSGPWQVTQLEGQIVMAGFQAFSFVFVAGPL